MRVTLVGLNGRYTHSCMALFYVRNELVENSSKIHSEILQFTINDSYYQILMRLGATRADYYFFSAAIWNNDLTVKIVVDLLKINPECYVVIGGPQAEIVGTGVNDRRCTVVVGEIEGVAKDFYRDLRKKTLKSRYASKRVGNAFSFPYVEADFATHLQNRHIYYESSRGCPFSCTYCLSSSQKGVFHKDLEQVRDELAEILKHNPKVVRFVDRTFNDNGARALAIWQFLAEQQVQTLFHFEISPSHFTEEMFSFLQELPIGKFQFEIGIQSTNPETLKAIRRPINTRAAHDIISRLSELGNIHLHVDLILGLPFETREKFLNSFRDVFAMNPHYIQMGLLKILPDTPMCHTAPEYLYSYSSAPPYSVFANRWLSQQTMQELYWFCECVERFLNNRYFVSLWNYLRGEGEDIVAFFLDLLNACTKDDFFQRAPTQQLLCSLILKSTIARTDRDYICELLRYDWLRCGHRFLPADLDVAEEQQSRELKKLIYEQFRAQKRPDEHYTESMYFLKKGFIVEFSRKFMKKQGYKLDDGRLFLCFVPESEEGVFNFSRVIQFSLPPASSGMAGIYS